VATESEMADTEGSTATPVSNSHFLLASRPTRKSDPDPPCLYVAGIPT
jgi:hypothetical protein